MKNLLYVAVIAALTFSCSVEELHDENSIDLIENQRGLAPSEACGSADIVNAEGDFRGRVEAIVDEEKGILTVRLTTYNWWKIKASKLFFGPEEAMLESEPGLFDLGKYQYTESFIEGVYEANYIFKLMHVEGDFVLQSKLTIANTEGHETALALGTEIPGGNGDMYVQGFLANCIK